MFVVYYVGFFTLLLLELFTTKNIYLKKTVSCVHNHVSFCHTNIKSLNLGSCFELLLIPADFTSCQNKTRRYACSTFIYS